MNNRSDDDPIEQPDPDRPEDAPRTPSEGAEEPEGSKGPKKSGSSAGSADEPSKEDRVRSGMFFEGDAAFLRHLGDALKAHDPGPSDDDGDGGPRSGSGGSGGSDGNGGRDGGRAHRPSSGAEPSRRPGPLSLTIGILAGAAALIGFLSRSWTEVLWFNQLGYQRIFWTHWASAGALFVVGFVIMFLATGGAMAAAYRAREIEVPTDEATRNLEAYRTLIEPFRRRLAWLIPAVLALAGAAWELAPKWQQFLLAFNAEPFGVTDPQFGMDISFYVFILPVLTAVVGFLIRVVIFAGLASVAVHYLYGGIAVARAQHVTRAARIHLTGFMAALSLLLGARYWLTRYTSLYSSNSRFDGAAYTDVNAVLPAQAILAAIAVVIAVLFIASIRSSSWRLPIIGVVVMVASALVIGTGYPVVIQRFVVEPNAQREESEYIGRNINATLAAYGLGDASLSAYDAKTTAEPGQLLEDAESTASIRLLDPGQISPTFRQVQQNKQYYSFQPRLNVDRYQINGSSRDTVIAVRELNLNGIGQDQRTWINDHTVYTHGYGVVTAYGNTVASDGSPAFWEGGIPSQGDLGSYEPRIYFGQSSPEYSIVGGDDGGSPRELDYPDDTAPNGQVNSTFAGDGGPSVSNYWNRLLYAVKFQEMNLLFSKEVREGSQILYDRNPAERVAKIAPWLTLDGNPYPAVVDDDDDPSTPKRVLWILDGYTTTNNYPYSQHDSLTAATGSSDLVRAPEESNYVRNSVKAVVDAYDGSVRLFEWDQDDPILKAWSKVLPGTVTPMSQMSADLMAHMRYPEDLFKVQRSIMSKYHVQDPASFYSGGDFWQVPDDPTRDADPNRQGESPQDPYYLSLKMPDQDAASFSLSSVFIFPGRTVLTAFMAVDSETSSGQPGVRNPNYGKIRVLELPRSSNIPGPGQVQGNFNSYNEASTVLNLLSQQGSQVIKGNLLTLPVGGGLLYVQPVYVQSSSGTQYPLLRKVLVSFGDKVGFADSLSGALDQVFGGDSGATTGQEEVDGDTAAANDTSTAPIDSGGADAGAPAADPSAAAGPAPTAAPSSPATTAPASPAPSASAAGSTGDPATDLQTALADAQTAMTDADKALKAGDWAAYGDAQKRLDSAISRAVDAQGRLNGK